MRRARKFTMYIVIVLVGLVIVLAIYNRMARISFANNRAVVSPLYCSLFVGKERTTLPVIFIPGTKGSTLSQDGKSVWLSVRQLLFGGEPLMYNSGDGVTPTGLLTRLAIIPGIFEYKPYQKVVAQLACSKNAYFYYYDWRKSPVDNTPGLASLVERVQKETGQKPSIVAHSMGGLVTHYYMKDHGETVNRVVYVGVPFMPGVSFLEDIDQGSAVGLNKTILSKAALFSHPGSFALLPHPGAGLYKSVDLFDETTWQKNRLSVYKDGTGDNALLRGNLEKASSLFKTLEVPKTMSNEFLFVVGNCQGTLYSVGVDGHKIFQPGDARVPASGALPVEYEQLDSTLLNSCAVHDKLLSDTDVLSAIFNFLEP